MTKKKAKAKAKTTAKRAPRKEKIKKVIDQAKEPFSLLTTLREEGMANLMALFTLGSAVASGATKNLKVENLRPALKELIHSLGFVMREDIERLETRVEELENKIAELEIEELKSFSDEDE